MLFFSGCVWLHLKGLLSWQREVYAEQQREVGRWQHVEADLQGRLGVSVSEWPQRRIPCTRPLIPRSGLG